MSADPLEGRERARFEEWCPIKILDPATAPKANTLVNAYWTAWQARAEQERWISVEERLPKLEHGGVGLCPCLFYAESTEKQFGGYYDPIYNDWLIATEDESRQLQVMDVSHWRPRPAPPVHKGDS